MPRLFPDASALHFATGRMTAFGVISAMFLWARRGSVRQWLDRERLIRAFALSLSGFSVFYVSLVAGVKQVGSGPVALIVGLIPITVPIFSRAFDWNRRARAALALILGGLLLINRQTFLNFGVEASVSGVLFAGVSLALWTSFAISNAKIMRRTAALSLEWSSLVGVFAMLTMWAFCAVSWMIGWDRPAGLFGLFADVKFLIACGILGACASWLAQALWNAASRRLPTGVLGLLVTSETVFGLLYGFIFEKRGPDGFEIGAIVCLIGGVLLGVLSQRKPV